VNRSIIGNFLEKNSEPLGEPPANDSEGNDGTAGLIPVALTDGFSLLEVFLMTCKMLMAGPLGLAAFVGLGAAVVPARADHHDATPSG
jgi:hypothetical protein